MISEQFIDEYDEIPDPRNRLDDLIEDLQKLREKYGGDFRVVISYDGGYEVYPLTIDQLEEYKIKHKAIGLQLGVG